MAKNKDLNTRRIETKLSEFAALVSLASDDVAKSKECNIAAEKRLKKLQAELEQLYILLEEPFFLTTGEL